MALRLATVEDVKTYLKMTRPEDDAFIGALLDGCSLRAIRYTGRNFFPDPDFQTAGDPSTDHAPPVAKSFTVRTSRYINLPDLRVATSVTLGGADLQAGIGYELWGSDDLGMEPYNTIKVLGPISPYAFGGIAPLNQLVVTGRWGFASVPEDMKDAVVLWVARRFKQRDANYSDVVQQGVETVAFTYFKNLPEDIMLTMEHYRRRSSRIAFV